MAASMSGLATFAFISRLGVILFQIFCNNLIVDHNAHVFDPPLQQTNNSIFDSIVQFCFGGFRRWDAVYFTHIAEHGYTYENCVAFFPLYPLIISFCSRVLFLMGILQTSQCVLLAGIGINCVLFSLAARNLYCLGIETGLNTMTSLLSVLVLCLNPASIFMTAPYSETLYFYLLTVSLLCIRRGMIFRASLLIAASIATRSNGLVGIGFIAYNIVQKCIHECVSRKTHKGYKYLNYEVILLIVRDFIKTTACLAICLSTFVLYQYYIYAQFCSKIPKSTELLQTAVISYGRDQGYKLVGDDLSPWCFQKIPLSYPYIQAKHWGVGFFKYYEVKQIPNFLLAAPVVFLSVCTCVFFVKMNKEAYLTLGLFRWNGTGTVGKKGDQAHPQYRGKSTDSSDSDYRNESTLSENLVVHVFHLAFLTIFGCCFIHIQVLTRLLFSSSPLLYWYSGSVLMKDPRLRSYVKSIISVPTTSDIGQNKKMLGNVVARKSLFETSKEPRDSFYSLGLWYHFKKYYNIYIASNVGVKIVLFFVRNWTHLSRSSKAIFVYCVAYSVIGTALFSNFFPWT